MLCAYSKAGMLHADFVIAPIAGFMQANCTREKTRCSEDVLTCACMSAPG